MTAPGREAFAKCPFKEEKSLPQTGCLDFEFNGFWSRLASNVDWAKVLFCGSLVDVMPVDIYVTVT
jgi:hypothetical protein